MAELNSALSQYCDHAAGLDNSKTSTLELDETRFVLDCFRNGKSLFGRVLSETDPARSHRALSLPLRHCLCRSLFQLSVPDYQRKYEWTEVNVRKLLNDLKRSVEHGDRCYSVGAPVFMVHINSSQSNQALDVELLDGQQRLTTLSIVYGVISALINDLVKTENPHVQELEDRFVCTRPGQQTANLVHLLTLQDVGDTRPQKVLFIENIIPLFQKKGPAELQRILQLETPDQLSASVQVVYKWLASFANTKLSGLGSDEDSFKHEAPQDHSCATLHGCSPLVRLVKLLLHLDNVVTVSPILLNMSMLATLRHRLFASLNSSGKPLSDIDALKNAVHLCASHPAVGAHPPDRATLGAWVRWTSDLDNSKFLRLLLTMRWTAESMFERGDVSGTALEGPELLEYFLAEPGDGRRVYTWKDWADGVQQMYAFTHPSQFMRLVKQWKDAADRLDEVSVRGKTWFSARSSNTLAVLACSGGVRGASQSAGKGSFAATCDMLALALTRWTMKNTPSAESLAELLGKLERLVAALRLAVPIGQTNHLSITRRLRRLADVASFLQTKDPGTLKPNHAELVDALALKTNCADGASAHSLACALLREQLYGADTERLRFVLAAVEAAAHRHNVMQHSTEVALSLEQATCSSLSQIEHILASSCANPISPDPRRAPDPRWEESGWTRPLAEHARHLLGNLVLLPTRYVRDEVSGNQQLVSVNQQFGDAHYVEKRQAMTTMQLAQNFRSIQNLINFHETWAPSDFVIRHLGVVGSLAARWGIVNEAADGLRVLSEQTDGPGAELFGCIRLSHLSEEPLRTKLKSWAAGENLLNLCLNPAIATAVNPSEGRQQPLTGVGLKFSKYLNVTWDKKKGCWQVRIENNVDTPQFYVCRFGSTEAEEVRAAQHRDDKVREWGRNKPMNFPNIARGEKEAKWQTKARG